MARTEARTDVNTWEDDDIVGLTRTAQGTYHFIYSQPDIAYTGAIALRIKRWAGKAKGLTVAAVEHDLRELEAANFVVIDWDREELLVRSLLRNDKVFRQPQILAVAREQLSATTSPILRRALLVELERIAGLEMVPACEKIVADMADTLRAGLPAASPTSSIHPAPYPAAHPTAQGAPHPYSADVSASTGQVGPSAAGQYGTSDLVDGAYADGTAGLEGGEQGADHPAAHPHGEWGVVTAVTTGIPIPHSPLPSPQLTLLPAMGAANGRAVKPAKPKPPTDPTQDPEFMDWYSNAYVRHTNRPDAHRAYRRARAKIGHDELMAKTRAWVAAEKANGREQKFFPYPASWLNGEMWGDELPTPARASPNGAGYHPYQNPNDVGDYDKDLIS